MSPAFPHDGSDASEMTRRGVGTCVAVAVLGSTLRIWVVVRSIPRVVSVYAIWDPPLERVGDQLGPESVTPAVTDVRASSLENGNSPTEKRPSITPVCVFSKATAFPSADQVG